MAINEEYFRKTLGDIEDDKLSNYIREKIEEYNWSFITKDPWIFCYSHDSELPTQGWKGHISAQLKDAFNVIKAVMPVLVEFKCSFKIAKSIQVLKIINDGHYPLSGANKFITFYPESNDQFIRIMKILKQVLFDFKGPRIYTDMQCGRNSILHYRYGAFREIKLFDQDKAKFVYYINDPAGMLVEDAREPWFSMPSWISNPLLNEKGFSVQSESLNNGPLASYSFSCILQRANKGNVYLAKIREDNQEVVIKEARAYVGVTANQYIKMLENEYRCLKSISDLAVSPNVIDYFTFAGNRYLVESFTNGKPLKELLLLKSQVTRNTKRIIIREMINCIHALHANQITHNDINPNNIIVSFFPIKVSLIDFENACLEQTDSMPEAKTIGFFNPEEKHFDRYQDDRFGLGMTIFTFCIGSMPAIYIDEKKGVGSKSYTDKIMGLLWFFFQQQQISESEYLIITRLLGLEIKKNAEQAEDIISLSISFLDGLLSSCEERSSKKADRLWDTGAFGLTCSKFCVQHGLAGIGMALLQMKKIPALAEKVQVILDDIKGFISKRLDEIGKIDDNSFLFGSSGLVWFLYDLYKDDYDTKNLERTVDYALKISNNYATYDYALGLTGYGFTQLKFWLETRNEKFLENVKITADSLMKRLREAIALKNITALTDIGYAHGWSGVFHYLYLVGKTTYNQSLITTIRDETVNTIIPFLQKFFCENESASLDVSWCKGLSGIGTALVAINRFECNNDIQDCIERIANILVKNAWGQSNCLCHGNAGTIHFLLDAFDSSQDFSFLSKAQTLMRYIIIQKYIDKRGYLMFKDESKNTAFYDYGVGSTGTLIAILRANGIIKNRPFALDVEISNYLANSHQ